MYTNLAQTIKLKLGRNTGLHVATDGVVWSIRPVGFLFLFLSLFIFFTSFSLNSPVQLHPDEVYSIRWFGHLMVKESIFRSVALSGKTSWKYILKNVMFNYWHYYNCILDTEIYALTLREWEWAQTGYLAKWLTL